MPLESFRVLKTPFIKKKRKEKKRYQQINLLGTFKKYKLYFGTFVLQASEPDFTEII